MRNFICRAAVLAAAIICAVAQRTNADLWNNGPYITHPNAPHNPLGTANVSQLQNVTFSGATAHNILGFNSNRTAFRLADDFIVPATKTWVIEGVCLYGYSTGFTTSPGGTVDLRFWLGDPFFTGVPGPLMTFTPTLKTTFDALRIAQSVNAGPPFTDSARRVFEIEVDLSASPIILGPGQYWLEFGLSPAAGATAVFTPPRTILNTYATHQFGPARQFNIGTGAWSLQLQHGGADAFTDIPFRIKGYQIPEPSMAGVVGLIGLVLVARRRRT